MFDWFRNRKEERQQRAALQEIEKAVRAYGALIVQHPLDLMPEAALPLPKHQMKGVLKAAWVLAEDDSLRDAIGYNFIHLANFRPDIASPINPQLTPGMSPDDVVQHLGPYMALSDAIQQESGELLREYEEFVAARRAHA